MPLHKRRTVFVKIDSSRSNGIFGIGAIWEFATALKDSARAMCFDHRLQEKLDNFRMQIATNQYFGGSPYERHIIWRDVPLNIDHPSREYQSNEFWENNCESFCRRKIHDPDVGILQ